MSASKKKKVLLDKRDISHISVFLLLFYAYMYSFNLLFLPTGLSKIIWFVLVVVPMVVSVAKFSMIRFDLSSALVPLMILFILVKNQNAANGYQLLDLPIITALIFYMLSSYCGKWQHAGMIIIVFFSSS